MPTDGRLDGSLAWDTTLADFETVLDSYLALSIAAQDAGAEPLPAIPPFTPPVDLGPLPDRLRLRATELAQRAQLVEAELGRVRDEVGVELSKMSRPTPVYDDDRHAVHFDSLG